MLYWVSETTLTPTDIQVLLSVPKLLVVSQGHSKSSPDELLPIDCRILITDQTCFKLDILKRFPGNSLVLMHSSNSFLTSWYEGRSCKVSVRFS